MGKDEKPWTEKHKDIAKASLVRLCAEFMERGEAANARACALVAADSASVSTATMFAATLDGALEPNAHVDPVRILRKVRASAEDREVVSFSTKWVVRSTNDVDIDVDCGASEHMARDTAASLGSEYRVVRVTVTRRRYLPSK